MLSGNRGVALGCIAFGGIMYLVPYFARKSVTNISKRDAMSGSQVQRGMFMNYGTKDVGPYQHVHQNIDHMFPEDTKDSNKAGSQEPSSKE